ncbi:hypothetical protein AAC387_Pa05g1475 [Persea americana]
MPLQAVSCKHLCPLQFSSLDSPIAHRPSISIASCKHCPLSTESRPDRTGVESSPFPHSPSTQKGQILPKYVKGFFSLGAVNGTVKDKRPNLNRSVFAVRLLRIEQRGAFADLMMRKGRILGWQQ